MNNKVKKIIFLGFSLLAIAAAIYHFIGIFYFVDKTPAWRHILFVFIDLVAAYGFVKRSGWFIVFFVILAIQQLYSHGQYAIRLWQNEHAIHWISIGIIILLPVAIILLIIDQRSKP